MTSTERKILDHMESIREIFKEECPNSHYLSLFVVNGRITFNNNYWKLSEKDCIRYADGWEDDAE